MFIYTKRKGVENEYNRKVCSCTPSCYILGLGLGNPARIAYLCLDGIGIDECIVTRHQLTFRIRILECSLGIR